MRAALRFLKGAVAVAFTSPKLSDAALAELLSASEAVRTRAFDRAWRHSRLVRLLRRALPLAGLALVLFVTVSVVLPWRKLAAPTLSAESVSVDGSSMTMAHPKLSGFRRDGRPYALTAEKAVQDLQHPTQAKLTNVSGTMAVSDALTLRLSAGAGLYDNAKETLTVTQSVKLASDTFTLSLSSASIDFAAGILTSDEPVSVEKTDGARISSDSFVAADNGRSLTFLGHVRTILIPSEPGSARSAK